MGMNHHQEPWLVFGMMLLFLGTIVSAVSYWRSRKSDSSTNGRRYAALGIMIMPTFFINGMLASLVIAGRLWMLLGVVAALGFFLYANYRVLSYGLRFLEADSNHESSATSVEPEATVVADMATPVSQVSLTPGV
jgi:membrane protein implicated in regulation of membrane protease activity